MKFSDLSIIINVFKQSYYNVYKFKWLYIYQISLYNSLMLFNKIKTNNSNKQYFIKCSIEVHTS